MCSSFTLTASESFTITNARHLAAKVATDLKRVQRLYGTPSDTAISNYEVEVTELLKANCLEEVTYGFQKDEQWLEPTLKYKAQDLQGYGDDDDPGKIKPGKDVTGATFGSFLIKNSNWFALSDSEREVIEKKLPIGRTSGSAPTVKNGYFSEDKIYTSGGVSLGRSTVRTY